MEKLSQIKEALKLQIDQADQNHAVHVILCYLIKAEATYCQE